MTTQLSPHFTLEELIASETASRKGISNMPTPEEINHAQKYLVPGLERVRLFLGHPIIISSGFRGKKLNSAVPGSSSTSQHVKFEAADFTCSLYGSPFTIAQALIGNKNIIKFDQLIYEYESWVHISFTATPRGSVLTKKYNTPYQVGLIK